MKRMTSGGGFAALRYTLRMARRVGFWRLWQAMRSKNACKTCALGMGGQQGGMRNEAGHWPEVCKKSLQAMVGDMQKGLEPAFFAKYSIAQLRSLSPRVLEWCGRLTAPLYAGPGDTHYRVVEWDFALDRLAKQLREVAPDRHFFYASGRSSNEAGFLLQLFARVWGTNYVNNCSFYCHQASGVGLTQAVGNSTATISLEDLEGTDLFFLIGGNPASNHPRLMTTFKNIRRRGGHVIVINPARELGLVNFSVPSDIWSMLFGTKIASLYVQPHIGGDIALLSGVARLILERGAVDSAFIEKATEGFAAFRERVMALSWADIETQSGVPRATIERIATMYQEAKSAVFGWTMGITHHEHGVENVRSIANLALLRGMVGRPHAGLMPIRGHSNVQGIGSMGVAPALKQDVLDNLEKHLGTTLPRTPGLDTMACMREAHEGRMHSALCLGGNLYGANPDAKFAQQAIEKLDLIAYMNTSLNTTHAWGRARETLILPVRARDEEPQPTTQESMFNFVRMSDGGPARLVGPRSEVDLITALAHRVQGERSPVRWLELSQLCHLREMIARVIPGFEQLAQIDRTRQEFTIPGRVRHEPTFHTSSGKAQFAALGLPELPRDDRQLRMMTIRSEGQFNTVVYEDADIYRGQERRDIILMAQADIDRLGLVIDQRVRVSSEVGVMDGMLVRAHDVRAGNAMMYLPEANVLVPTRTDPQSKTPAFKSVLIRVDPVAQPVEDPGRRQPLALVGS